MTGNIVELVRYKRSLGMIATSGSWRRFWLPWRWITYPRAE
ncbi:MAG TPA: hypothetical protein PLZ60_09935 [Kiritimatiellia bacterium]|nr:hypothetical protein [Kiritimatiellia bacterium]